MRDSAALAQETVQLGIRRAINARAIAVMERDLQELKRLSHVERLPALLRLNQALEVTYVSRRAALALGWEPEELIGQHVHDVFRHPIGDPLRDVPHDAEWCSASQSEIARGRAENTLIVVPTRSGKPVSCYVSPLRRIDASAISVKRAFMRPAWEISAVLEFELPIAIPLAS